MKTLELTIDQINRITNGLQSMIERNNEILNSANHLPDDIKNSIRSKTMKYKSMLNYLLTE